MASSHLARVATIGNVTSDAVSMRFLPEGRFDLMDRRTSGPRAGTRTLHRDESAMLGSSPSAWRYALPTLESAREGALVREA